MSKRQKVRLTESEQQEAPQNDDGASSIEAPESTPADVVLVESVRLSLLEDATISRRGSVWEVVIISEGWSKNDRYYSREALERSIPLWEDQVVCAYGYDPDRRNHVPEAVERRLPEGTYLNKIGFLRGVHGRLDEAGRYELVAEFVCTKADVRQELVETLDAKGRLPGFSIHADGDARPGVVGGRSGIVVTEITETKELTLVTHPAAKGRALRLVAGQDTNKENEEMKKLRQFLAARLSAKQPKALAEAMTATVDRMEDKAVLEAVAQSLRESGSDIKMMQKALDALNDGNIERASMVLELAIEMIGGAEPEAETETPADDPVMVEQAPASAVTEAVMTEAERRIQAYEQRAALREAKATLSARLAEAKLPKLAEDQLREEFGNRVFNEAELDKAIERVNRLLAINGGGDAQIERATVTEAARRNPHATVLIESDDKFQLSMNLLMGYDYKHLHESDPALYAEYKALDDPRRKRSIKRLYQEASGDWDCVHIGGTSMRESVNNTTFSKALGDSVNLKLQQDFERQEQPAWRGWIEEENVDNLNAQKRVFIGGIGELPDVAEGGDYTDLGEPIEFEGGYSLTKKGGIVEVTEEAIINDRTSFITNIPRKLREAALESEDKLAYGLTCGYTLAGGINAMVSYDGEPHYDASHFNYATAALSHANFLAARQRLRKTRVLATVAELDEAVATDDATTIVIKAANKSIRKGMYLRIDSEWMLVTSVSTVTIGVQRGMLGSVAATHADNSKVYVSSGLLRLSTNGETLPAFYAIVPTDLEATLEAILMSEKVPGGAANDYNMLRTQYQQGLIKPVVVDPSFLGGSDKSWFLAAPWQVSAGIVVGYYGGQRAPQLINQTNEQVGRCFAADVQSFKIKHRIGGAALFHEGRTGNIVS